MENPYADAERLLKTLFKGGTLGGLTDGQLLERFTATRDEIAFAALVERHGPMVLDVCRQVLGDLHDAQDAFQATFLVLVHRAGSVRKRDSVASWLYGVAYRVAACARSSRARRREHERMARTMAERRVGDRERSELGPVLSEEMNRLPEPYRAAAVLCYLEGHTCEEAARQLGCPAGTVKSRLARARARLQTRLVRRGVVPSAIVAGTSLSTRSAAAPVPSELAAQTVQAALRFAAGGMSAKAAPAIIALTENTLRSLMMAKLKMVAPCLLAFGLIAAGAVVMARQGSDDHPGAVQGRGNREDQLPAPPQPGLPSQSNQGQGDEAGRDRTVSVATQFFSIPERARSFAYVIDRSGSMATRNSFDVVKRELRASLEKLTPDARFSVTFYNLSLTVLTDAQGHPGPMAATEANKARVRAQLEHIVPDGGTDLERALRLVLAERAEAIYFLTDGDLLSTHEVDRIIADAGKTRINVLLLGRGTEPRDSPLRMLASKTGGNYRYFDVRMFPAP